MGFTVEAPKFQKKAIAIVAYTEALRVHKDYMFTLEIFTQNNQNQDFVLSAPKEEEALKEERSLYNRNYMLIYYQV